ncbi:hypothetical protein AD428_22065 [Achromobacter sp. DMS1]|nr:hypothetical protein AD428_22065 [Achromobacter sp. DMS1]
MPAGFFMPGRRGRRPVSRRRNGAFLGLTLDLPGMAGFRPLCCVNPVAHARPKCHDCAGADPLGRRAQ